MNFNKAASPSLAVALILLASACHPVVVPPVDPSKVEETEAEATEEEPAGTADHEDLSATLWVQTSMEYRASALQAYSAATQGLNQGLQDPTWTASPEQLGTEFKDKPAAIIVDVDDTVLDNSPFHARLIKNGEAITAEGWDAWCKEANSPAVPGAVTFTKYAQAKGVTVFYVTNRDVALEGATRQNLAKAGLPLVADRDTVLMRGEKEGWGDDKTSRRQEIANEFRILMQVGDSLGDFMGGTKVAPAERFDLASSHSHRWGVQWIVLPNPITGEWEPAAGDRLKALRTEGLIE